MEENAAETNFSVFLADAVGTDVKPKEFSFEDVSMADLVIKHVIKWLTEKNFKDRVLSISRKFQVNC